MGRLTDVPGLRVGHWTDEENVTGCTVILCEEPFVASGEVRGGAPGTRETDLLAPGRLFERVDAIVLSGGSAFGLAAADGVVQWLRERGRGYPTGIVPVPIVPAAILFDLGMGRPTWPDAECGYRAAEEAGTGFATGSVGAGTGATVGKFLGPERATKSGIGTAALGGSDGLLVAALAVVNALGSVVDPSSGEILAGPRLPEGGFADFPPGGWPRPEMPFGNTTVAVVAANARADRVATYRMAQVAHDGLARAIRPVHTQWDGDTVFSLVTGEVEADLGFLLAAVADTVAAAVVHAVLAATSLGGLPARKDLPRIAPR